MMRPLLFFAALVLLAATGCLTPIDGPAKGEGDTGEGEGEGQGEGEGDLDVNASGIIADSVRAPADGIAFVEATVVVVGRDGNPVVGRPIAIETTGGAAVASEAGATDGNGRSVVRFWAQSPMTVSVVAVVDNGPAVSRLGPLEIEFTPCLGLEDSFTTELWGPVFSRCVGCHNEYGLPLTANYANENILKFPGEVEFAQHNVAVLRSIAMRDIDASADELPFLVAYPTGRLSHTGGTVIEPDSTEEALLISFVARLRKDTDSCGVDAVVPADAALAGMSLISRKETLARARLALTGVPLSPAEEALPLASDAELEAAIDAVINAAGTSDRVVEIYNDWLWTDRYTREVSRTVGGVNILLARQGSQFGERNFHFQPQGTGGQECNPTDVCCGEADSPYPGTCDDATLNALDSLAREPLELIRHIWNTDLRADAIANADFTVANPYTAIIYGFSPEDPEWTFNDDETPADNRAEFRPLVLKDTAANTVQAQPGVGNRYPHAGILTTGAVMQRFINTTSNRERRRSARVVYERLLGIDVMKLAAFSTVGLPADADLDTATTTEVACTSCHAVMDPVGRLLFSFGNNGEYRPGSARAPANEMFGASFMGERFCSDGDAFCSGAISGADADERTHSGDPVTWLADRIVQNPRFGYAMVLPLFQGLTGAAIVRAPTDPTAVDFAERNLAFVVQNSYLTHLAQRFDGPLNRNLKALAKEILTGPFFRGGAFGGDVEGSEAHALALAGVGRGALITPEQLSRKLLAFTGELVAGGNGRDLMRDFDEYRLLFGGVNWESLTVRFREPNPVMMRIVERAASQVACRVVVEDLAVKATTNRKLLTSTLGTTEVSEPVIRGEIARLQLRLWGEEHDTDDAEVDALYELFADVVDDAQSEAALPLACRVSPSAAFNVFANDPSGAARAWIAVTAALLSDPLFVVE